jgi:hypothetical protein
LRLWSIGSAARKCDAGEGRGLPGWRNITIILAACRPTDDCRRALAGVRVSPAGSVDWLFQGDD